MVKSNNTKRKPFATWEDHKAPQVPRPWSDNHLKHPGSIALDIVNLKPSGVSAKAYSLVDLCVCLLTW